jgi:hypothetical protein
VNPPAAHRPRLPLLARSPSGEPLAQPLVVTLEKTGAAVLRVLLASLGRASAYDFFNLPLDTTNLLRYNQI